MQTCILPREMKALETAYMTAAGVPSILLMEYASRGVYAAICRHARSDAEVVFLCGPGANGGDGYAAARLWAEHGGKSIILEVNDHPSGDARLNRFLAGQAGCLFEEAAPPAFSHADLIVDALFGTGLSKPIAGKAADLIRLAAESGLPCIAVDIPSGIDGESGKCLGTALHCIETITFHRPKAGLFLCDGPSCTGNVIVEPILIPRQYGHPSGIEYLETSDLPRYLPSRSPLSHKGTYGRTLILAGSEGMAGAAAMCASAAVASGSGLTTILCPAPLLPVLQTLVPAAMCRILPEDSQERMQTAAQCLDGADRAVIGCGLSQNEDLLPLLRLFREADCPVIWDADALNLLSRHPELLPLHPQDIITPHPGEASRLLGCSVSSILENPLHALRALHEKTGAHVLLKGACTLMTNGQQEAVSTLTCPALAKGGSGDILSGILAALTGRVHEQDENVRTLRTMECAAMIHTLAGRRAALTYGDDCVTPQAVIASIRYSADL